VEQLAPLLLLLLATGRGEAAACPLLPRRPGSGRER